MAFTHFPAPRIDQIVQAALACQLTDAHQRALLLDGIHPNLRYGLPALAAPLDQLRSDLARLNNIRRLADGTVPIEIWLRNAARLSGIYEQGRVFQEALDDLTVTSSGEAALPPIDELPERPEAIVHQNDMVPFGFLEAGALAGQAVAKLSVPRYDNGVAKEASPGVPEIHLGTGWLVTPELLITNHHVVNARDRGAPPASGGDLKLQASNTSVQFDYNGEGQQGDLAPVQALAAWSRELDYAVLRLAATAGRKPLRLCFKRVSHIKERPLPVNIIQHPDGKPKRVALRNNLVVGADQNNLLYFTDTEGGSSGSPVLDDFWRVVALHRAVRAVEPVTFQGRSAFQANVGTQWAAIADDLQARYAALWQEIGAAQ